MRQQCNLLRVEQRESLVWVIFQALNTASGALAGLAPRLDDEALSAIPLEYIHNYEHRLHVLTEGLGIYERYPTVVKSATKRARAVTAVGEVLDKLRHGHSRYLPLYSPSVWENVQLVAWDILCAYLSRSDAVKVQEVLAGISNRSLPYKDIAAGISDADHQILTSKLFTVQSLGARESSIDAPDLPVGERPLLPDLQKYIWNLPTEPADFAHSAAVDEFRTRRDQLMAFHAWAAKLRPDARSFAAVQALYGYSKERHAEIQAPSVELSEFVRKAVGAVRAEVVLHECLDGLVEGLNNFEAKVGALPDDCSVPKRLLLYWRDCFLREYGALAFDKNNDLIGVGNNNITLSGLRRYLQPLSKQPARDYYVNRVAQAALEYSKYRSGTRQYTKKVSSDGADLYGKAKDAASLAYFWLQRPSEIRLNIAAEGEPYEWVSASLVRGWTEADSDEEVVYWRVKEKVDPETLRVPTCATCGYEHALRGQPRSPEARIWAQLSPVLAKMGKCVECGQPSSALRDAVTNFRQRTGGRATALRLQKRILIA